MVYSMTWSVASGAYETHLRRIRKIIYLTRRDCLTASLARLYGLRPMKLQVR